MYFVLITYNNLHTKSKTICLPWVEVDAVVVADKDVGDVVGDELIDVVEVGIGFFAEEM